MKNKTKILLHLLASILICFVVIYLYIFFGGWKLAESGDPIQLEFLAAVAMGFIFWIMYEITCSQNKKIAELEERITALEKRK